MRYIFIVLCSYILFSCEKDHSKEQPITSQEKYDLFEVKVISYDVSKDRPTFNELLSQPNGSDQLNDMILWTIIYSYHYQEPSEVQGEQMNTSYSKAGRIVADDGKIPMIWYQLRKKLDESSIVVKLPKYTLNAKIAILKNGEIIETATQSKFGEVIGPIILKEAK